MASPHSEQSDEQVLADPGSHTVDEVKAAFANADPEQVDVAKQIEAEGQGRKGITDWEAPKPKAPAGGEPVFERERLLGPDGPQIAGCRRDEIAGALHGVEGDVFTRQQVAKLLDEFRGHDVSQQFVDRPAEHPEPEQEG